MENQENNNLSELDQLKAQYETLKQQFDQQEIVNDRLMKSSINHSVNFYRRYRWKQIILYPLFVLLGLLIIKWHFDNNLYVRLFFVSFCLVSFAIELWVLGILRLKTMENSDLLTLSNHARSFKKLFTLFNFLSAIPMLILVLGFLLSQVGDNIYVPNLRAFLLTICLFFLVFGISMTVGIRHITRPCDEIIQKIEASDDTTDKKTGLDKKQKWFCFTMIVVFLWFDIWAYSIVGYNLKLPPMWRSMEYVRSADDISTEGKLEFWEVYTDTVVSETYAPTLLKQWQQNDSLVVMVAKEKPTTVGLDATSIHEWKEEEKDQVKVYMLKKTTPEGPAISSPTTGGQPLVQKVEVTRPSKYPSDQSVPIIVQLTPEASQLWYQFTTETKGRQAALSLDGIVVQEWKIMQGLDNGCFFIMKKWESKEELETFCKRLIKQ